ncbi:MAG TPA: DinB family protein [Candidatus Limnocylindrales bacterium]|nr:DinB family protein [Candidatus Limnocylindrales bacterium]
MRPTDQPAVRETVEQMDAAWSAFRDRVHALPRERLEHPVAQGEWTRKQMLGHIWTWHDMTTDRLSIFLDTGAPNGADEDTDVVNERAARAAGGRTTGEILGELDDSFRRLRREVLHLTDEQLLGNDGWAAAIIAGNSYGHYEEHAADLVVSSSRAR